MSEFIAAILVSNINDATGKEGAYHVVTDCLNVLNGVNDKRDRYKAAAAGYIRQLGPCIKSISKVKAHQTREKAEAEGWAHDWIGNDRADHHAKEANRVYAFEGEQLYVNRVTKGGRSFLKSAS